MTTVIQRSFAAGELTPSLHSRVDLAKYATGLATCRNCIIQRHGGAMNRPGTTFMGEVKDSSKTVRLIPFEFNAQQTYMLEFGHLYMRVIRNGVYQYDLTLTITAVSNASTGVVTYTGTDPTEGQEVYISGITGAIGNYLNGRNFKIGTVDSGANTFQLKYMDGTAVNTTSMGAYTSGGTAKRVYTLTTPYVEADLQTLNYDQSGDIITLTHNNYYARELSRTGHTSWSLDIITFAPGISAPTSPSVSGGTGTGKDWIYKITAVAQETFEESLPSAAATLANKDTPTASAPNVVTFAAVTGAQEYNIYRQKAIPTGTTGDGIYGFVGVSSGTTFNDDGISPDFDITPPIAHDPFGLETAVNISGATQANPGVITTSAAHGMIDGDLCYIESVGGMTQLNNLFFLVVYISTTTFSLTDLSGTAINTTGYGAYTAGGTVKPAGNFPACSAYFQNRHLFANTRNNPEDLFGTRSGNFKNLSLRSPLQDDDALQFPVTGRNVNAIRAMVDLDGLIVFTAGGEVSIEGNSDGVLTPGNPNPRKKSYIGSSTLSPLIIGTTALIVQAHETIIRDFYNDSIEGFKGEDLSIYSAHLFDGYAIRDWTYQQIPNSIAWAVREDGVLLGLTYIREHKFAAWHRHDFDGTVEQVCSVSESNEDAVYLVIKRTINGATKRYVERMNSRFFSDVIDAKFVDCGLSYDGRNTGAETMTLSGGTDWLYTETLTLTRSSGGFTSADVGNQIFLTGSDDEVIRFTIDAYTSSTVVTGRAHKTVPASLRSTATADWARAVDEITGLWHLEGKSLSIFADRFVVANPNNDSYTEVTVENGAITLDAPYAVIHAGLPITSDIQTLDIDTLNGETIIDKKKLITDVTMQVENTRGLFVGGEEPDADDDFKSVLKEPKLREAENYDDPVDLRTGHIDVKIQSHWNSNGRVFIRQTDPIPMNILSIAPSGFLPIK